MNHLNTCLLLGTLLCVASCTTVTPDRKPPPTVSNQFQAVWNEVTVDPVEKLPQDRVSFRKVVSRGKNIILGDATRTLDERANVLQPFDKLAHPNGICFKGVWKIDVDNKYSGYFKKNSKALIIARASAAMSNTKRGTIRSFGLAGKLFPTMNPSEVLQENTANFFLIDDLGGTRAEHYTDVTMTNEPEVSINSEVIKSFLYVLKLARTFSQVDKNPGVRQVYEISELGESDKTKVVTPRWMKVEAKQGQTVEANDFRDELRTTGSEKLIFVISVASEKIKEKIQWLTIGTISLNSSVISKSCDHRLHFHHPKWKSDLTH